MADNRANPTLAASALLALLFLAPGAGGAGLAAPAGDAGSLLRPATALLDSPVAATTPLPADPQGALAAAVAGAYGELGLPDAPPLAASGLPDDVAGRLALGLEGLRACAAISQAFAATADWAALLHSRAAVAVPGLRACAEHLWTLTGELQLSIAASGLVPPPSASTMTVCSASPNIDFWPVLRVTGTCNDLTVNDYMLQVDLGGNDVYDNAAGSNMMDLRHGTTALLPPGSTPTGFFEGTGVATGCQVALNSLEALDCVPLAAVLLDMSGNDHYNVFKAPDVDAVCTADLVVRRQITVGAGFAGVGILRDAAGNDDYNGKTGALGAGHIGGIGVLQDDAGNDHYLAARNAEGFSLIGDVGILHDLAGNDDYGFYMPAPLDPSAPDETPGAGGVIDDTGVCDNVPRFDQGTADVGGVGILLDEQGNDQYVGSAQLEFISPIQSGGLGGSQGFGQDGGFGILLDRAGSDAYSGVAERGNHVSLMPGGPSTNTGFFQDT